MRNKLCMLLLLLAWFSVSFANAQNVSAGLTAEQEKEKQLREVAETNRMLLMRQNPQGITKETVHALAEQKAKQRENPSLSLSPIEREAATRQKIKAYFLAHPDKSAQYGAGNLPPVEGVLAVLEAQGVTTLAQVSMDKLSEAQKVQLFETEPWLKQAWENSLDDIKAMDKKHQDQFRKKLWAVYVNEQSNKR